MPLPGDHGQIEGLARVLERRADRCLITASPEQSTRLREWLRGHSMREPRASGVPATHRPHCLVAFSSPAPQPGFGAREVILDDGQAIGELVSRARLPGWQASLSLGRVQAPRWRGQTLQTVAGGQTWPLSPRRSAWDAALRSARG